MSTLAIVALAYLAALLTAGTLALALSAAAHRGDISQQLASEQAGGAADLRAQHEEAA